MEQFFLEVLIGVMTATFVGVAAMLLKHDRQIAVHGEVVQNHKEQLRELWEKVG